MTKTRSRQLLALLLCGAMLYQTSCVPHYFFQNLVGSSISSLVSVILSDTVNVLLPVPTSETTQ